MGEEGGGRGGEMEGWRGREAEMGERRGGEGREEMRCDVMEMGRVRGWWWR